VDPTEAARGLSFDAVFVPGVAERMFPRKKSSKSPSFWTQRATGSATVRAAAARAEDGPRTPPPSRKEPASGGALADALRRAGVTADKNGPIRTKPR
jgi:hypothetical protein